jgi:hypothetical protein
MQANPLDVSQLTAVVAALVCLLSLLYKARCFASESNVTAERCCVSGRAKLVVWCQCHGTRIWLGVVWRLQVADLGAGNFGVCKLMIDLSDGEHVAVKFLERGNKVSLPILARTLPFVCCHSWKVLLSSRAVSLQIDRNVQREILVHCQLHHPCASPSHIVLDALVIGCTCV